MVRVSVDLGVMLNRFKFWRHINWNTVTYRLVAFSASEVSAPLKLRPYGAIQICLLLLLL